MQTPRRHLTKHRRQRLVLWALAMLTWIASVLFAGREAACRQLRQRRRKMSLQGLERMTIQLLIVRAAELARLRPAKRLCVFRHGRSLLRRHYIRSLLGSRLRRTIKRKQIGARIAALIDVLRDIDRYAQILGRRMKRRLTRLFPLAPAPTPAEALYAAPAGAPACADTS